MSDEKDLINRINRSRRGNIHFLREGLLDSIHKTITDKLQRINNSNQKQNNNKGKTMDKKAEAVILADKNVRAAIQELAVALFDLNDKEIAQRLLAEHIFILNNIFKEFE
ncbi:MAG TPA: hypothetical protein PLE45_08445 [Spirochaetota bacterium]|nr:hypothetical protein [Spirochaetota bacterium]HOL57165.1 hypothetical protein [Spirochaetota bacterium]HPP04777.1 hypothetical protein [Spirochaetota bacterium]